MLGFKLTVISGVLSTLLASIFTWLFGYWPHVWSFIVEVASTAWWGVSYSVPMPMSVLVLLWFFLMYMVYRLRSISGQAGAATTDGVSTKPTQGLSEMSEKELAVMFHAADGTRHATMPQTASRLERVKSQIDLCVWIDGKTRKTQGYFFNQGATPNFLKQLCTLLGVNPAAIQY